jgi:CheY-like chemotaxis protein
MALQSHRGSSRYGHRLSQTFTSTLRHIDYLEIAAIQCTAEFIDELWDRLASNIPRPPIGKHVLIAGVSGPNNQLYKRLVELQGSTTMLTRIGEQALQAAIEGHPDLIIVDVMGSQEFELGRILKGDVRTREIPLIGVSAQDKHLIVAAGYDEFVAKPIGIRNFGLLNFLKLLDRLLLP